MKFMQKNILNLLTFVLVTLGSFILNTSALSCANETLQDSLSVANSVFIGKVLSVDSQRATFEVSKYWKGNLSSQVTTQNTTYWTGYTGGNIFFKLGGTYIIGTNLDSTGVERNSIDCSKITSEYSYQKELEIINVLGNPRTPYSYTPPYPANNFCPNLYSNLWYGNPYNNRNEVRELQTFLFNHYGVSTNPTGFFGRTTKYYLTRFQNENGINATGGLGPITRNIIANMCGNIVGGDRDEHGCIASAGYSWCAVKNRCIRSWEESCGKADESNGGPNCKVWYDGCNTCSRQYVGGPMMCTLMACIQGGDANWFASHQPVCREYFSTNSQAPVIKSFSGPVQLQVNEKGTWKVETSIFNNQQLTYNISWGDERSDYKIAQSVLSYLSSVFPQNTTFEHSYASSGTYTVTITVTGANGQTAKTTSTVNVTSNNYNYPVACTADAYQCPNGTWVGRTGSNCQFICPAY